MPIVMVSTATIVKPGLRRSPRAAYRTSDAMSSIPRVQRESRNVSRLMSLPISIRPPLPDLANVASNATERKRPSGRPCPWPVRSPTFWMWNAAALARTDRSGA
jgi:hypothetical protein